LFPNTTHSIALAPFSFGNFSSMQVRQVAYSHRLVPLCHWRSAHFHTTYPCVLCSSRWNRVKITSPSMLLQRQSHHLFPILVPVWDRLSLRVPCISSVPTCQYQHFSEDFIYYLSIHHHSWTFSHLIWCSWDNDL